jgi:hypothetical protein
VTLPGIGPTDRRVVIAGAGVAVVIGGVYWYRSRGATTTTATDGTSAGIDPVTGYESGSEQDLAALNAMGLGAAGDIGSGLPDPTSVGSVLGGTQTTIAGPVFTDNHAWSQYVEEYLITVNGLNASRTSAALGAYLAGRAVTDDQRSIIDQATAVGGLPPVAGLGGYPPAIRHVVNPAIRHAVNPVTKLRMLAHTRTSITAGWAASPRATSYQARLDDHAAITLRSTYHDFGGLAPGSAHRVRVQAEPAAAGAAWASVTLHTADAPGPGVAANPPAHLQVLSHTRTSITVGWTPSAHATGGYQVRRDTRAGVRVHATRHTFTGLARNSAHVIRVQAEPAAAGAHWASLTARTQA